MATTIGPSTLNGWAKNGQIDNAAIELSEAILDGELKWLPDEVIQLVLMAAAVVYGKRVATTVEGFRKDSMMFRAKSDDKEKYNASEAAKYLTKVTQDDDFKALASIISLFKNSPNPGNFQVIEDCVVGYLEASLAGYGKESEASTTEGQNKIKHALNVAWKSLVGEWFEESIKLLDDKVRKQSEEGRPLWIPMELKAGAITYPAGSAYYPKQSLFKTLKATAQYHQWEDSEESSEGLLDENEPEESSSTQPAENSETE